MSKLRPLGTLGRCRAFESRLRSWLRAKLDSGSMAQQRVLRAGIPGIGNLLHGSVFFGSVPRYPSISQAEQGQAEKPAAHVPCMGCMPQ